MFLLTFLSNRPHVPCNKLVVLIVKPQAGVEFNGVLNELQGFHQNAIGVVKSSVPELVDFPGMFDAQGFEL